MSDILKDTLGKKSGIWVLKSKFFLYRVIGYFSFLLLPVYLPKSLHINQGLISLIMIFYISFMISQWYLLGKEIDHRLKIYFKVNSSLDRLGYRIVLGLTFIIVYFNLLSFLPGKWIYNMFWVTWVVTGVFYSWPTRGKIIQESVSSNFGEYRYLDRFEKTLVILIGLMFFISIPELPPLQDMEALKLFFDPNERIHVQYWNFLVINYYPFLKYPQLFKLAWSLHFYIIGCGTYLVLAYTVFRYFLSRRLSLLGVFALLSSWSYSQILGASFGAAIINTYNILWVWCLLWVTKSATYRAGLFWGMVGFLGALVSQGQALLFLLQAMVLLGVFLKEKTFWFKRQTVKYSLFGFSLALVAALSGNSSLINLPGGPFLILKQTLALVERKAFFSLSLIGIVIFLLKMYRPDWKFARAMQMDPGKLRELGVSVLILFFFALLIDRNSFFYFGQMWLITFLSLIPLEMVFQSISRLRSRRNMIYLVYIIICLLDSHFEGRVKIFLRLFDSIL